MYRYIATVNTTPKEINVNIIENIILSLKRATPLFIILSGVVPVIKLLFSSMISLISIIDYF